MNIDMVKDAIRRFDGHADDDLDGMSMDELMELLGELSTEYQASFRRPQPRQSKSQRRKAVNFMALQSSDLYAELRRELNAALAKCGDNPDINKSYCRQIQSALMRLDRIAPSDDDEDEVTPQMSADSRRRQLLGSTPLGRSILAEQAKKTGVVNFDDGDAQPMQPPTPGLFGTALWNKCWSLVSQAADEIDQNDDPWSKTYVNNLDGLLDLFESYGGGPAENGDDQTAAMSRKIRVQRRNAVNFASSRGRYTNVGTQSARSAAQIGVDESGRPVGNRAANRGQSKAQSAQTGPDAQSRANESSRYDDLSRYDAVSTEGKDGMSNERYKALMAATPTGLAILNERKNPVAPARRLPGLGAADSLTPSM